MSGDKDYKRRLHILALDVERRSERIAASWRRILPFLDPLDVRFLALERQAREAALAEELRELRRRLRGEEEAGK
ncbi:MAG: hypothetical protein KatS3mg057_1077 [Herpetosiphonaceae bacterium]|nr:MAG: hypothetical protein KatS3mg057_1077 [Herpetosiphonaceae bacterium]